MPTKTKLFVINKKICTIVIKQLSCDVCILAIGYCDSSSVTRTLTRGKVRGVLKGCIKGAKTG